MRVITWNIRKGKGGHRAGPAAMEALAESLSERSPDLILCQEVFNSAEETEPAQTEAIADALAMFRTYVPNATYNRGDHGNATLSRFEIVSSFNQDLSTNPVEKRGVLYGRCESDGKPLHVFNTHLGLNRRQRRKQVDLIAHLIGALCPPDDAVILGGDFNDWTGRLDAVVAASCGLESAIARLARRDRKSWPNRRPLFSLDRIYYRGIEPTSVRVLQEPPFDRLSDHLPLEVDFAPP